MTDEDVKKVVLRLVADDKFNKEFHENPKETIRKAGYSINDQELKALSKIKPEDIKKMRIEKSLNETGEGSIEVGKITF